MDDNAVGRAIEKLGGITQAIVVTGVSASTWLRWRENGWIADAHVLLEVAEKTGMDPRELAKPTRRSA